MPFFCGCCRCIRLQSRCSFVVCLSAINLHICMCVHARVSQSHTIVMISAFAFPFAHRVRLRVHSFVQPGFILRARVCLAPLSAVAPMCVRACVHIHMLCVRVKVCRRCRRSSAESRFPAPLKSSIRAETADENRSVVTRRQWRGVVVRDLHLS